MLNVKETLRRSCAIIVSLALAVCYSGNGGDVKANSKSSKLVLENVTDAEKNEKTSNFTEGNKDKGKKAYLLKTKTKSDLSKIQKKYSPSDAINENGNGLLQDNKAVSVELSESQAKELKDDMGITFIEEDKVITASFKSLQSKNKSTQIIKGKKAHKKKVKNVGKNTSSVEWNVRMINAENKAVKDSNRIKVAILDSGVDWGNDIDLAYQVSLVPGENNMTQIFMDGSGHGTSVASLIAANDDGKGITGINSNVDIYSYRVLDDANKSPVSRVIEAIYMAMEENVNIINMSFGLDDYSQALEEAIHAATEKGILIIAAAGNTGEKGVQYPAAYSEVMAVGAVNKDGLVEDYSAKGEELEIVAPGELVKTTGFLGAEEVTSGTSLAAPQVAAVATLIWQKDPGVSADFVRGLLNESANLYGEKNEYGNGLVDAEYALNYYDEYKSKYKDSVQTDKDNMERKEQIIKENEKKVITFSDTGCVKGSWLGDDHVAMIDSAKYCVRTGARFPDTDADHGLKDSYFNGIFVGMTDNPWWHGYHTTNYFKATIYAACLAKSIGGGGGRNNVASWLNYNHYNNMDNDVNFLYLNNEKGWNRILSWLKSHNSSAKSQKNSNGFKRAVLWGMAIHTATDVYSHSTDVWGERIKHEKKHSSTVPDADNRKYISNRYKNASTIASRMMYKYVKGDYSISASDLQTPNCRTVGYRIINYVEYMNQIDPNYALYSYTYSTGTK